MGFDSSPSIEIGELRPVHVQEFETRLSHRLTPKGVHAAHSILSGAMRYAERLEFVARNPVTTISPPSLKRREPETPDISAVRRALDLAREEEHYLYPAMRLIAYTGMRRGEALGLFWDHVDLDAGAVTVQASLVRSREKGLMLEPPKTRAGRRTVDLDAGTSEVLAAHREAQLRTREVMREAYRYEGRVFADKYGGWVHPARLYKTVKSYGRRAGYEGMSVRSLRHFHASVALQTGQNVVVVSQRLGHASVSITSDIYAHSLPGWQREAADAFAKAMEG